jgi:hypothetical protein
VTMPGHLSGEEMAELVLEPLLGTAMWHRESTLPLEVLEKAIGAPSAPSARGL